MQGWFQIIVFCIVFTAIVPFLGGYMARVFTGERVFLSPVVGPLERLTYRILRAGDGKVGMYQVLRAGGRLDSEFFPESIVRRTWPSAAEYCTFLRGRHVDRVDRGAAPQPGGSRRVR